MQTAAGCSHIHWETVKNKKLADAAWIISASTSFVSLQTCPSGLTRSYGKGLCIHPWYPPQSTSPTAARQYCSSYWHRVAAAIFISFSGHTAFLPSSAHDPNRVLIPPLPRVPSEQIPVSSATPWFIFQSNPNKVPCPTFYPQPNILLNVINNALTNLSCIVDLIWQYVIIYWQGPHTARQAASSLRTP